MEPVSFSARVIWLSLTLCAPLFFAAPSAFAFSRTELIKAIREKVVEERAYEFGTEDSFTLKEEQALQLKCTKNPDRIEEILICFTSEFYNL